MNLKNNIGYACVNLDTSPSSFRTCRRDRLDEQIHKELIEHNLKALEAMVDYNILHGVKLYRISSSLIPFASSSVCTLDWKKVFARRFEQISQKIKSSQMRISVYPGQYTMINSPKERLVQASIRELEYQATLLDLFMADDSCKIILRIGGIYEEKEAAILRFVKHYKTLPNSVKKRLAIENDDKKFHVEDVLKVSAMTGAPVIFDNLHHKVLPSMQGQSEYQILEKVISTWDGMRPQMHYSQQAVGERPGTHSSTICLEAFMADYEQIYRHFDIDIMLEAKDKNRSFQKVNLFLNPGPKRLEAEWARYKYLIMSKSYEEYSNIRKLFKKYNSNEYEYLETLKLFLKQVDASLEKEPSLKNMINALEHVWGYFKKKADEREKDGFLKTLSALKEINASKEINALKEFNASNKTEIKKDAKEQANINAALRELYHLALKYEQHYLLSSYLFHKR